MHWGICWGLSSIKKNVHDRSKLLQENCFISWLLCSCSPHMCSLKKSLLASSTWRARAQRAILIGVHQHLPVLSLLLRSPLLLPVWLQTLTLSGRLTLRSYFLTKKVKGERLALISALTRTSLWLLFLEALHLSHADLSSLVPFFLKQWHRDLKNWNYFSCSANEKQEKSTLNMNKQKTQRYW